MSIDQKIALASLAITVLSFFVLGVIAYLTLKFTAKPKIKVSLIDLEKIQGTYWLLSDKNYRIQFQLSNVARFYAKHATSITKVYLNFDSSFEIVRIFYGSNLEIESQDVLQGKGNSKYCVARNIQLFYGEGDERIDVEIITPKSLGVYKCWLAARAENCDHGIHLFKLKIL